MTHLRRLFEADRYSTQAFDVYLAEHLEVGTPHREPSEHMVHACFSKAEPMQLIRTRRILASPTLAALTLYALHRDS